MDLLFCDLIKSAGKAPSCSRLQVIGADDLFLPVFGRNMIVRKDTFYCYI